MSRIPEMFAAKKAAKKSAFIAYIMAGDPSIELSLEIMKKLPAAGVDLIELGMAFSDPMADGPTIQAAGVRALDGGITLKKTLGIVREFRKENTTTPIVLMGYLNPIYHYGFEAFLKDAADAGLDGVLVADLPIDEDHGFAKQAADHGLNIIQLFAPTTSIERAAKIAEKSSGFMYYVSIAGVTGTMEANVSEVEARVKDMRKVISLPIGVGFGIKTPDDAKRFARFADAVIVGSSIVKIIEENLGQESMVAKVIHTVEQLSNAVHKEDLS